MGFDKDAIIQIIINKLLDNYPNQEIMIDAEDFEKYKNPYEIFQNNNKVGIRTVCMKKFINILETALTKHVKGEELNKEDLAAIEFIERQNEDELKLEIESMMKTTLEKVKQKKEEINKHKNN